MLPSRDLRTQFVRTVQRWLLAALAGAAYWTSQAAAQPPAASPTAEEIGHWINDLGNDSYTVRQAAAERLTAGGFAARAALDEVAEGPDPEIRSAARRLVTLIDQSEFSRRLAEFAADADGRRGVTLPGWKEFGELVGRDEAARALFVEMQRQEAALLDQVFDDPPPGGDLSWEDRLARLLSWRVVSRQGAFAAPLGSCATMFFLSSLPEARISDNAASSLARLAQLPPVSEAMGANRPASAVRRLVSAWVVNCPSRNDQVIQQRLELIFQHQLAEALPLARELALGDPKFLTVHPARRVTAILAVGRFGTAADVNDLETLLDDHTDFLPEPQLNVPRPQGQYHSVQVRDVALATMLHLTEQEPMTYGFLHVVRYPLTVFNAASLGMENDERRSAAAEQWRAWRAEHDFQLEAPR